MDGGKWRLLSKTLMEELRIEYRKKKKKNKKRKRKMKEKEKKKIKRRKKEILYNKKHL